MHQEKETIFFQKMNNYLLSRYDRKICKKNLEMQLIPKTVSMHKENHGILLPKLF